MQIVPGGADQQYEGPLTVELLVTLLETWSPAASVWVEVDEAWCSPVLSASSTPSDLVLRISLAGLDESD